MHFTMPTKIYVESNCVRAHAAELCSLGKRALIVTGKNSSKKNGSLDDVISALKSGGVCYAVFDEVEENPSVETVMKARDLGVSEGADFVIGIGGGSPLDAAKAVALMTANPDSGAELLYENRPAKVLPVAAVPTTCGTGSEATGISVLTVHTLRTKASIPHRIYPEIALADGKYLADAPLPVIRNTATDAFAHLVESALNSKATMFSRTWADKGLSIFAECRKALIGGELDDTTREKLMTAAVCGGIAISHTGTAIPHGLSYRITYECGVPHGKACGMFLAGYIAEAPDDQRRGILAASGFDSADAVEEFYRQLCGREHISAEIIHQTVLDLLNNPTKLLSASYPADEQKLRRIAERYAV